MKGVPGALQVLSSIFTSLALILTTQRFDLVNAMTWEVFVLGLHLVVDSWWKVVKSNRGFAAIKLSSCMVPAGVDPVGVSSTHTIN